jgi:hypothetical protein
MRLQGQALGSYLFMLISVNCALHFWSVKVLLR